MRINPYELKRPAPITETRTFTDPASPAIELALTLSAQGGFNAMLEINRKSGELVRDFVTGVVTPGETSSDAPQVVTPPTPLIVPNFGRFTPSETLCYYIAQLMYLQTPAAGEAPYDFVEWCIISETLPTAFSRISAFSDLVLAKANGTLKNEHGASTAQ